MNKSPFLLPLCAIAPWADNVVVSKPFAPTIAPSAITFYRLRLAVALMRVAIAQRFPFQAGASQGARP